MFYRSQNFFESGDVILQLNMQLWFWSAVLGGVLAGISNFCFKIAAKREYDAESFSLYGGITSIVLVGIFFPFLAPQELEGGLLMIITLAAGAIATFGGIMKVYALRHIDTTIFFPLFKLFGPLIAVVWRTIFSVRMARYLAWTFCASVTYESREYTTK
jgi:drug/metabolite transporter (DMT)-like permease